MAASFSRLQTADAGIGFFLEAAFPELADKAVPDAIYVENRSRCVGGQGVGDVGRRHPPT